MDLLETASEIVASCRSELCLDLRFMTMAVLSLEPVFEEGSGIPAVDGRRLVMDPGWVVDTFRKDPNLVTRAIAHSAMHCILGHVLPSIDSAEDLAQDMTVEYVLDSLDTPHTTAPFRDERMYAFERMAKRTGTVSLNAIAAALRGMRQWETAETARINLRDSHSRRDGEEIAYWSEVSRQAMAEVEGFSKSLEGRTGPLLDVLRIRNRRTSDWRGFLRKFMTVRSRVKENLDEFDPIYYTLGMSMYGNVPLIDSLEYSDTPSVEQFVIAIDTSGSTIKGQVEVFLDEAFNVMRQAGAGSRGSELHVIQCDEEVRSDHIVCTEQDMRLMMDGFRLIGGGGTDFRPVFEHIAEIQENGGLKDLRGMLYFTDGRGIFPEKRPPYDVAFVFCDDSGEHEVPPWAMKVETCPDDLEKKPEAGR